MRTNKVFVVLLFLSHLSLIFIGFRVIAFSSQHSGLLSTASEVYGRNTSLFEFDIGFTDYGWLSSSSPSGRRYVANKIYPRRIWEKELFDAIQEHPNYNPSAFRHPSRRRPTLLFLDLSSCAEQNYPVYNSFNENMDTEGGRRRRNWPLGRTVVDWTNVCRHVRKILHVLRTTHHPHSRLMIPHCNGGYGRLDLCCGGTGSFGNGSEIPAGTNGGSVDPRVPPLDCSQIIFAYQCRMHHQIREGVDIGLPPPAVKPNPNLPLENDPCDRNRTSFYFFEGAATTPLREKMKRLLGGLHDYVVAISDDNSKLINSTQQSNNNSQSYEDNMYFAQFAGAPRGDVLFSYRFSEILSYATIPVVYADGWVRPFLPTVVNWDDVAVFIAEKDVGETDTILRNISVDRRCAMQRNAKKVWERYLANRKGVLEGLINVYLSEIGASLAGRQSNVA